MRGKFVEWKEFKDQRGALSAAQWPDIIPFPVHRIFYIYEVASGMDRGNHAHKELEQFIICLHGSIEVHLVSSKEEKQSFSLNRPNQGVYVPPMTWARITDFSEGAVCLVLASDIYKESDYIQNYQEFIGKSKK